MKLVSIDQSIRSSGVTIADTQDNSLKFLIIGTEVNDWKSPEAVQDITKKLTRMIIMESPDQVIIEGLPYGLNSTSVRPLGALFYNLQNFCKEWGIPVEVMSITKAKKCAGKGNLKKDEMYALLPEDVKEKIKRATRTKKARLDLSDSFWLMAAFLEDIGEK